VRRTDANLGHQSPGTMRPGKKVRSRLNIPEQRVVASSLASRWSAAAISTKRPHPLAKNARRVGHPRTRFAYGILACHPFAKNAKGWGTLILYKI